MGQELGASRRGTGGDPRRRFRHLVTILCSMVLLVGAFVVSGVPLAGADPSIPNCSSGGYPCGYYISVNGTSELAGESTISPSVITTGTEVVQTATVETGPQSYTSGNISGTTGIYYVTITGLDGPLVSYSPQGGDGITTSVNGSQVTWGSSTPFSEGAVFTLTNIAVVPEVFGRSRWLKAVVLTTVLGYALKADNAEFLITVYQNVSKPFLQIRQTSWTLAAADARRSCMARYQSR